MRAAFVLAILAVSACMHGTPLREFTPATSPAGITVSFRLAIEREPRSGELFAADSTGITVRTSQLMHVSWTSLRFVRVPGRGTYFDAFEPRGQSAELVAQLALLSRYPQGLDGPLLAEVLRSLKQDALGRVY